MTHAGDWVRVCALDSLPDQTTRGVGLGDDEVILVNWFGKVFAYLNRCPHAGWPLNYDPDKFLDEDERYLQCSNHMALFEVEDGTCVAGPCPGEQLTALEVSVKEGVIYLRNAAGS